MREKRPAATFFAGLIILTGYTLLVTFFSPFTPAGGREFFLFLALGVLAEVLYIRLPAVNLSFTFGIILATFLVHGINAAAWVAALSSLLGSMIMSFYRPMSLTVTFFNGAQYILAVGGGWLLHGQALNYFQVEKGSWPGVIAFAAGFLLVNFFCVHIFFLLRYRKIKRIDWLTALKWDVVTCALATAGGMVMAYIYRYAGLNTALLFAVILFSLNRLLESYVRIERSNRYLRSLVSMASSVGRSFDLQQNLKVIVLEARRLFRVDACIIFFWHEKEGKYCFGYSYPYEGAVRKTLRDQCFALGEGLVGFVAEKKEPLCIPLTSSWREIPDLQGDWLLRFFRSLYLYPLVEEDSGRVVGVLVLGHRRPIQIDPEQKLVLESFGRQAQVAITNSLLYKKNLELAQTDGLTGLYNHRYFYHKVAEEFERARRYNKVFSLIIADIDDFKAFNDRYGHVAGDKVLKQVAHLLRTHTRNVDTVACYGGEEFAILLPETGKKEAVKVAERICQAVAETPFVIDEGQVRVTLSMGTATYPNDARDLTTLVDRAEQALYLSKERGKNRVTTWEEES
ncbi:MAG: hypothetical protein PWQ91_1622 [Eubacteriales bacterium]|nr:hypothetical protein [Eubacteriales bacterium]MDN5364560.1 hypothetical protein [Eubacteriales bacterium]